MNKLQVKIVISESESPSSVEQNYSERAYKKHMADIRASKLNILAARLAQFLEVKLGALSNAELDNLIKTIITKGGIQ